MADEKYSRDEAFRFLNEYVKGETLLRHSLTVEAVMRHFAELYREDADRWGIIGLLHDIDFELYPQEHCRRTRGILEPAGYPEELIRAVESHGYGLVNDVKPQTNAEKILYTVDELTGLISATALMRPSRSILDMEPKSVKKKWKQKGFAANVSREVIAQGAEMLGMELDRLIAETIAGMKTIAGEIGLAGELSQE